MGKFLTAHKKDQKISELSQNLSSFQSKWHKFVPIYYKSPNFQSQVQELACYMQFCRDHGLGKLFSKIEKSDFFSLKNDTKTLNLIFLPNIEFYHINHLCKV